MSTKIGHFEIISELSKSPTSTVYKANDLESNQTIALKAIQLSAFGEDASALEQALLAEAESAKVLSSSNVVSVCGAGVIDGQFCAAMEYVQGNSIATMLARKEGFTIWDLLDIGRQLCSALDHARSHNIVHYSVEPAKIMCGWDGSVKLLSFGVSSVGKFLHLVPEELAASLFYMSPEQVQGQEMDARSNLFSLGAIFYEMVTERKPFDREDVASLQQSIVESTPVAPIHVNQKVHPLLSDLILKALQKDPAQRYQNGRELLDDLEKCKETKKTAAPAKKQEAAKGIAIPSQAKAAAQAKFVNQSRATASAKSAAAKPPAKAPAPSANASRPAEPVAASSTSAKPAAAAPKAAAAAAGAASGLSASASASVRPEISEPELDLSDSFIAPSVKPTIEAAEMPSASMSAEVIDQPQVETFEPQNEDGPKIAIDPMMAEGGQSRGGGTSFSEISELPPLKEVYIAPAPVPAEPEVELAAQEPVAAPAFRPGIKALEKPKVQAREVAQKAIKEVKNVPPKLMMYALGGAGALILAIAVGVTVYVHTLNSDDDAGSEQTTSTAQAQPAATPAPAAAPAAAAPSPTQEQSAPAAQPSEPEAAPEAAARQPAATPRSRNAKKKAPVAPAIILGQMQIDSTPLGAQVTLDGKSDPSYVTPFALANLTPGQHSITIAKQGFVTDTRTVTVTGGNRAAVAVRLTQVMATLVVNSTPAGANVYIDGHDTGTKTPAQVSVDKGQHVVLVRKMGYIDETMNAQFLLGQTFNFSPSLRLLGNSDNIRTIGKMSKLFGGKAQAGQTTVNIRTQPKGAQVAINQHVMEKNSPIDVALDPGSYVIDITMTGYAPIHKVITADQGGGKVVVDETLQPQ